jgi:hypothetical protein
MTTGCRERIATRKPSAFSSGVIPPGIERFLQRETRDAGVAAELAAEAIATAVPSTG